MFNRFDVRSVLPILSLISAFFALIALSFMHLDEHQLGRLFTWAVVAGSVCILGYTLWSGEFRLRGRPKPFIRNDDPINYWMATAIAAIVVSAFVLLTIFE